MTLRAVFFDAGNTLVFLDYDRLAREVGNALGLPLTGDGLRLHAAAAAQAMEEARFTDQERGAAYLLTLFALAGVGPERTEELKAALLALHRRTHLWGATQPGTREALEQLRDSGLRLAVISNSDGRASAALEAAGLRDLFAFVIDSGEVGIEKPDPRIFGFALARMGTSAAESLYVGDLYEVDAVGARAAGMAVVLIDPARAHVDRDVRTVASVAELVAELLAPAA